MHAMLLLLLALIQKGGSTPAIGSFGYGAGLMLIILATVIVGFVFVALFRAGGKRR